MNENATDTETGHTVLWPFFVAGFLSPVCARVVAAWLPAYVAAGLTFFVLFAAASALVAWLSHPRHMRWGWIVTASAGGAIVTAVLTYAFP